MWGIGVSKAGLRILRQSLSPCVQVEHGGRIGEASCEPTLTRCTALGGVTGGPRGAQAPELQADALQWAMALHVRPQRCALLRQHLQRRGGYHGAQAGVDDAVHLVHHHAVYALCHNGGACDAAYGQRGRGGEGRGGGGCPDSSIAGVGGLIQPSG